MHGDAYFSIGKSHTVCEDYALSEPWNGGWLAAVADGCSSSTYTDVGARLLVHALRVQPPDLMLAADSAIRDAAASARVLQLPEESLDATLLCIAANNDRVVVVISGDGFVVSRHATGDFFVIMAEYPSGAPQYLNYRCSPYRHQRYIGEFGATRNFRHVRLSPDGEIKDDATMLDHTFCHPLSMPNKETTMIAAISDGLSSFQSLASNPDGIFKLIPELCTFKNTKGSFVQRRLKRFIKDHTADKDFHADDISMAAICLEE